MQKQITIQHLSTNLSPHNHATNKKLTQRNEKGKENCDYDHTPATELLGPYQTIQYGSHHSTEVPKNV
jgi:hypothetical protein